MEVLISNYKLSNIQNAEFCEIDNKNCLLWVWHADKVPPHLGVSVNGYYFSLKANGKDSNLEVRSVVQLIDRKKIKTLCFELDVELTSKQIENKFNEYESTIPYEITCLKPIQELLQCNHARQLVELLCDLDQRKLISNVYGFNLPADFDSLAEYTTADIHARLKQLRNE